jgi:hypothetical protein
MPGVSYRSVYNLLLHENELVNPFGQDASTARRLINFIPTKAGVLRRKEYAPPFSSDPSVGNWFSFVRDYMFYVAGVPTRQVIVGVSNNVGTFLDKWVSGGGFTALPVGAVSPPHNPGSGWIGDPLVLYSDGLLYISDGTPGSNGTVYDGTDTWKWGLDVPAAPTLTTLAVAAGLSDPVFVGAGLNDLTVAGPFTGGVDATYEVIIETTGPTDTFKWRKNAGAFTTGVRITTGSQYLRNGVSITFAAKTGHTVADKWTITAVGLFIEDFVEYALTEYDSTRKRESAPGARLRVAPDGAGYYKITIALPARANPSTGWSTGAADKFRIYRSSLDGTTQLYRLAEVAASDGAGSYQDFSPFYGDDDYVLLPIEPPFRNQKPKPSKVGVKFHNRFALRDEARKSRIWITGFREILEQSSFSPALETAPGTVNQALIETADERKIANVSDFENFVELTNEAFEVRAMLWFRDGVMLGTEKDVVVMFGRHPEDPFSISNTATYKFGVFHKNGFLVTTHGLVIFTADRRLVLDPAFGSGGDRTNQVTDIGWPKQPQLDKTDIRYTNRFEMAHYQFGQDRDWLVIAYTTQDVVQEGGTPGGKGRLLIYDFQVGGWISFDDVRATCIGLVQENEGFNFLVAGGSVDGGSGGIGEDRKLRVLAGYDSSAISTYGAAAGRIGLPAPGTEVRPANIYRSALMDVQAPELWKVWQNVQFYVKPGTPNVTVKYWGDPADIDNLGAPDQTLTFLQLTSGAFEAWVHNHADAKRAVFQFEIASGGAEGALEGIQLKVLPGTPHGRS